jgi:hypothetical protein
MCQGCLFTAWAAVCLHWLGVPSFELPSDHLPDTSQEHKTMSRGSGVVIGVGKRNPNEKQKTRKGKRNK